MYGLTSEDSNKGTALSQNSEHKVLDHTHSSWGDSSLWALKRAAFVRMGGGCRLVVMGTTDEWLAEGTSIDQSGSVW